SKRATHLCGPTVRARGEAAVREQVAGDGRWFGGSRFTLADDQVRRGCVCRIADADRGDGRRKQRRDAEKRRRPRRRAARVSVLCAHWVDSLLSHVCEKSAGAPKQRRQCSVASPPTSCVMGTN